MCPLNPEPWPSPCLPRAPASRLGRCRALWVPLSLCKRVKDAALTLLTQPIKERLPWPGPSPLTSLPGGPSPQISLLPAERLVRRGTTPSQLKVPEPRAHRRGWQRPRKPGSLPTRGCCQGVHLPRSAPGGQEAQSAPYSPRPKAVRRLAQGAGFLEEISRKSAGPLASGSLPNPAGARSSPAPLAAPGEGWEGAAGSSVPPFLLLGEVGVARVRQRKKAPGPAAADKHLYPSPHYGGHVLHILGRLGAGGGVSSRDWRGTDGEPHPVYPLVL